MSVCHSDPIINMGLPWADRLGRAGPGRADKQIGLTGPGRDKLKNMLGRAARLPIVLKYDGPGRAVTNEMRPQYGPPPPLHDRPRVFTSRPGPRTINWGALILLTVNVTMLGSLRQRCGPRAFTG